MEQGTRFTLWASQRRQPGASNGACTTATFSIHHGHPTTDPIVPRTLHVLCLSLGVLTPYAAAQPWSPETLKSRGPDKVELLDECEVIARVNGQVILACEVLWQVNLILEEIGDQIPPKERERARRGLMQKNLMSMLDMKILYGDFRRKAPMADLAAIHENLSKIFDEEEVPRLMKRVDVEKRSELPERLHELGTSMRQQREDFYWRMIARSWVNQSIDIDKEVRHDKMLAYYEKHSADFEFPTQAKWEELVVEFSEFNGDRAKAYAELCKIGNDAYRAATAQPDKNQPAFAAIAKARSQGFNAKEGGQYDWTTQGSLADDAVDEALFTLPIGEMSPILKSDHGFHIVRVLDRKLAGKTPFTEVQAEITKKIRDERFNVAISQKLDELRREAQIWTVFAGDISEEYRKARSPKNEPLRK